MRQKVNFSIILMILVLTVGACNAAPNLPMKSVLKTDDTLLELNITAEGLYITKLANGDKGANWANGTYKIPLLDRINLSGGGTSTWKVGSVTEDKTSGNKVEIVFVNDEPKLKLRSIWWAHPGVGPVEHFIELINDGNKPADVGLVPSLDMSLKLDGTKKYEHWWIEKGAHQPSNTGVHRADVVKGFVYEGVSTPYCPALKDLTKFNENVPWQCIHNTAENVGIYTGIESSARVSQKTETADANTLRTVLKLDESLGEFKTTLQPGEIYKFPPIFVGCFKGDLDDCSHSMHRWLEKWVCPSSELNLPLLVNNSWGSGMQVDEPMSRKMIEDCVKLGIEMFHVDAGWYKAVGWWYEDTKKFPSGLKAVNEYAHNKGLKVGLWVGWTQGGDANALPGGDAALCAIAPNRKNWFAEDLPSDWKCPGPFTGKCVCLAHQPAFEWCLNDMTRCVRDYNLNLLEHDQQMVIWDCTQTNHGHSSSPADISNRGCWNYYKVHETLMKRFPGLLIENCVNGGRMTDFGVIRYSHYTCGNDRYNPMALRRTFYDLSYMLPPRIIEGYIGKSGPPAGPSREFVRYRLRSNMLGWCSFMMFGSQDWNAVQYDEGRKQFAIYKEHLRPQIREGNFYHISERPNDNGWDAYEYYTPAKNKGVIYVFRALHPKSSYTFKLKGLEPDANYELKSQDGYLLTYQNSGKTLMESGFTINIPKQQWSDLVYITKK